MRAGHSLLELLVVLMMLGAAASLVLPPLRARPSAVEAAAINVRSVLQRGLREAVLRGESARVVLDATGGRYWVGAAGTWPRDVWHSGDLARDGISYTIGTRELVALDIGSNGSAAEVRIAVTDGKTTLHVELDAGASWPIIR